MTGCILGRGWVAAVVLTVILTSIHAWSGPAARADAPVEAGAVVRRLMVALRANDRAAFLDAVADDYNYNGQTEADLDPFGPFGLLYDRLLYRIVHLLQLQPGLATALVDSHFTGRLNLESIGAGQPAVVGTSRLWVEVRQQHDGQWRISALRPVRVRFAHGDTPQTFLQTVAVNDATSVSVGTGTVLNVEGESWFGLFQLIQIGAASQRIELNLQLGERWHAELPAPQAPGRYYLDTASVILAPRPGSGLYLSWDQTTAPVIVRE
jgi:hypothetical protein